MTAATCRNGLHPISQRITTARGTTECRGCRTLSHHYADLIRPGGSDGWSDPIHAAERAERLAAWQAGVDAAIARMRLTEGFDGTRREWRTLGECLPAPDAPAIVALLAHRRAERLAS